MPAYVTYERFGAKGNGKTDDLKAIVAAHAYANERGLPVRTAPDAVYYIGGRDMTAVIGTDTDWGTSRFIIDDREVENINQHIFYIPTAHEPKPVTLDRLVRGQKQISLTFASTTLISVKDNTRLNYIRRGPNASSGHSVSDTFLVAPDGKVLNDIMWDFPQITSATARRIEETPLCVRGGSFLTIANDRPSKYTYFARDIAVRRSRVTLEGIRHRIEGEGEHGAPYGGFLQISGAAYVTLRDCDLTGHKIYITEGVGSTVPMGSYDITVGGSAFVMLKGITQVPDIMDNTRWGLIGTNYCKDLTLEGCRMSRFDAHCGVTNATVRDCQLGWQCVAAIGQGRLTVERTSVYGHSFISLRPDYGSVWDGPLTIRDCEWYPDGKRPNVVSGNNDGTHDFGYECTMPQQITIDGLTIHDDAPVIESIAFLGDYADRHTGDRPYPYGTPSVLSIRGVSTDSGRIVEVCRKPELYPDTEIKNLP
ncbi:MAG: hypothetical protein J6125_04475 [Clostridia bacterium]|nr:hypothetical protein [Clostridia bacterium]